MASGAILAGGRASRFRGRNKGALRFGGASIFERQVSELARVVGEILVVGAPDLLAARPSPDVPVRLVADRMPGCGPLGGLDAALAAACSDVVVVLACDMPFVTADLIGLLLSLVETADAAVPRTERGYHPLCAAYTRACQNAVARHLAIGRLRMSDLLGAIRVREVTSDDIRAFGHPDRLLANINTEAEYAGLQLISEQKP